MRNNLNVMYIDILISILPINFSLQLPKTVEFNEIYKQGKTNFENTEINIL